MIALILGWFKSAFDAFGRLVEHIRDSRLIELGSSREKLERQQEIDNARKVAEEIDERPGLTKPDLLERLRRPPS
jgi:hypothetical protein